MVQSVERIFSLDYYVLSALRIEPVSFEDDLTVLIDFERYQQLSFNPSNATDPNKTNVEVCADLETEEYRKCGKKCISACRHAPFSSGLIVSKVDCDETKCVKGCFCKDGFVRHQNKCIMAKECPVREHKAMRMMSETENPNKTESHTQNIAQNHTQAQMIAHGKNQTQIQFQQQNPKIFGFGFFNRCTFGGCGPDPVPVPVQVQSYDESVQRKENNNKVHSQSGSYILWSIGKPKIDSNFGKFEPF